MADWKAPTDDIIEEKKGGWTPPTDDVVSKKKDSEDSSASSGASDSGTPSTSSQSVGDKLAVPANKQIDVKELINQPKTESVSHPEQLLNKAKEDFAKSVLLKQQTATHTPQAAVNEEVYDNITKDAKDYKIQPSSDKEDGEKKFDDAQAKLDDYFQQLKGKGFTDKQIETAIDTHKEEWRNILGGVIPRSPRQQDQQAKYVNSHVDNGLNPIASAAGTFDKEIVNFVAAIPKAVGIVASKATSALGKENDATRNDFYKLGTAMTNFGEEYLSDNPKFKDSFLLHDIPATAGQLLPFMAGGEAIKAGTEAMKAADIAKLGTAETPNIGKLFLDHAKENLPMAAAASVTNATGQYEQAYNRTKDANELTPEEFGQKYGDTNDPQSQQKVAAQYKDLHGRDPNDVGWGTFKVGLVSGAPFMFSPAMTLNRLNKVTGGLIQDALNQSVKGGIDGLLQFGSMKAIENLGAQATYEKTRDILDGVVDAGSAGFMTNGILTGLMAALSHKATTLPDGSKEKFIVDKAITDVEAKKAETDGKDYYEKDNSPIVTDIKQKISDLQNDLSKTQNAQAKDAIIENIADLNKQLVSERQKSTAKNSDEALKNANTEFDKKESDDLQEELKNTNLSDSGKEVIQGQITNLKKGGQNAIQIGEPTATTLETAPSDSKKMGEGVPKPKPEETSDARPEEKELGTVALFESGLSIDDAKKLVNDLKEGKIPDGEVGKRLGNAGTNTVMAANKMDAGKFADVLDQAIKVKEAQPVEAEPTPLDKLQADKKTQEEFIQGLKDRRDHEDFKSTTSLNTDRVKVKRLKTPEELKASTDKINDAIKKAESELADTNKKISELPTNETANSTTKGTPPEGVTDNQPRDTETIINEAEVTAGEAENATGETVKVPIIAKIDGHIDEIDNKLKSLGYDEHEAKSEYESLKEIQDSGAKLKPEEQKFIDDYEEKVVPHETSSNADNIKPKIKKEKSETWQQTQDESLANDKGLIKSQRELDIVSEKHREQGINASRAKRTTMDARHRIMAEERDRQQHRALNYHEEQVKEAIKYGKYDKAISEGTMTAEKAAEIIKSAGLEVPTNKNKPSLSEIKSKVIEKAPEAKASAKKEGVSLKVQKNDLLSQIDKAHNSVKALIEQQATPKEIEDKLKADGFETTTSEKGVTQVVFDVEGDGTFKLAADGLETAYNEVKKHWKTDEKPVSNDPRKSLPKLSAMGDYSTPELAERSKQTALENLEQAKKSGDKNLEAAYQKQAELESEKYKEAKKQFDAEKRKNIPDELKSLANSVKEYKTAKEFQEAHIMSSLMDLSNPQKHRFGRIFLEGGEGGSDDLIAINKLYGTKRNDVIGDYSNAKVPRVTDPEQIVTIYRSAHTEAKAIEAGDWVSFSKEYAESHDRGKTISMKVPAKDVIWGQQDMNEWVYSPDKLREQYSNLKDFYDKTIDYSKSQRDKLKDKVDKGTKAIKAINKKLSADLPEGTQQAGFVNFDRMVDVAADLIKKGIDLHGDISKAIDEAIEKIKGMKLFDKFSDEDKERFEDQVREQFEDTAKEEQSWTSIKKRDLTDAQELLEKNPFGGKVSWNASVESGMKELAEGSETKSLYEGAHDKVNAWAQQIKADISDKGKSLFNPNDQEIAQMMYYRAKTRERMADLERQIASPIEAERNAALLESNDLQDNLDNIDYVIHNTATTAGRSFNIRQMMGKMDADDGLQIKRVQLMKDKGGKPLTEEEETALQDLHDREQKLIKDREELHKKFSQEEFDRRVKAEVEAQLKSKKSIRTSPGIKESGKRIADSIRKLKMPVGSTRIDFTLGTWDLAVEGVAKLVEGGATIADAVKRIIDEGKIKFASDKDHSDFTSHLENHNRNNILQEIKDLADTEKSKELTKSAVGKNLVRDLVNDTIDKGLRGDDVLTNVHEALKEHFPDITEQQVRDAYLKEGDYKLEPKENLNKEIASAQNDVKKLAKIESDIADLRANQELMKRTNKPSRKTDSAIAAKEKELTDTLNKAGIKLEKGSKAEIAEKTKVAEEHNKRVDGLTNLIDEKLKTTTDEEKPALESAKIILERAKVNPETVQDINQSLDRASKNLDLARNELSQHDLSDVKSEIAKSRRQLADEQEAAKQKILLDRYKKQKQTQIKQTQAKIDRGEFVDSESPYLDRKDAASILLEIENRKIQNKYKAMGEKARREDMSKFAKFADWVQTLYVAQLIGSLKTAVVVGASGALKQPLETLTRATTGNVAKYLFPSLAKATRGEGFSLRQEAHRYQAHYAAIGENGMMRRVAKSQEALDNADINFEAAQKKADGIKAEFGEHSTEYNDFVNKELTDAKNKQSNAIIDHMANSLYSWIGSNAWTDAADVFLKGASRIEDTMGYAQKEAFNKLSTEEKLKFIVNTMGATHAVLKNFSARAEFAASFVARLENKMANDIDIRNSDELLKTANESWINYQRGKYQEDNFVINKFKAVTKALGEPVVGKPEWNKLGELSQAGARGKYPILKTPLNIAKDAIMEYTFGLPIALARHSGEAFNGLREAVKNDVAMGDMRKYMQEYLSKMDPDKADMIYRCYRKGGFALGMYALAATGVIKFGGFYNQEERKNKHGLDNGELKIGDHKLNKVEAKIFTHLPYMMPVLMYTNYERVQKLYKNKGTAESNWDATHSDLEGMLHLIPLGQEFRNPLKNLSVPFGRAAADISELFDVDDNGNLIERAPTGDAVHKAFEKFEENTGFRKFVHPHKYKH